MREIKGDDDNGVKDTDMTRSPSRMMAQEGKVMGEGDMKIHTGYRKVQ